MQPRTLFLRLVESLGRYGPWVSATLYFVTALLLVDFREIFEIDYDESYNLAKAALWAAGEPLYTRIWSDQPPLLTILLAGVHSLFPWNVDAARILILVLTSGMVACVHCAAARIAADARPASETRLPGLLAGFGAAILLAASAGIIRMSFAVDVGTPAVTLAAAAACVLVCAWSHLRPHLLFASGALLGLACGTKLFVAFLVPVFLLSVTVASTPKPGVQRWNRYPVLRASGWWTAGLLTCLAVVFGPMISPELVEQLVMPHLLGQGQGSPSLPVAIFHGNLGVYSLAALGGAVLWVTRRGPALLFVTWLIVGVSALCLHHPVWPSHGLLILVPAVVVAAAALGSLAARAGRYQRVFHTLGLGMGVALVSFSIPRFIVQKHWETGAEPSFFYPQVMRHLDGYHGQLMVTSRQTLAFRAGMLVPAQLAVTSSKRFETGFLDIEQVIQVIEDRKVAFVFEDGRWPIAVRHAFRARIAADYCRVMVGGQARLWQRRDLVQAGECLRPKTKKRVRGPLAHRMSRVGCGAPVIKASRAPTWNVHGLHSLDPESALLDEVRDRAVEVASPSQPFPDGIHAILPAADTLVRSRAMLAEDEFASRLQNPGHPS